MTEVKRRYRGVAADDRRTERRRALLEACLDLIGASGTSAVTAESVSAQAKLTKRYFYESFTDRDAILGTALDEMFVELVTDIREAIARTDRPGRAQAVTEVFVSALCRDPRRARLYAESPALPALAARRDHAIIAFTDLMSDDRDATGPDPARRRLMTRIVVSGVTDVVTSWIDGTLAADRATLTDAIVTLGRSLA